MGRLRPAVATFLLLPLAAAPAFAHGGERHLDAGTVAGWWTWEPWVLAGLALSAVLYLLGVARLWRRAGPGRGIRRREAACFAAGWAALVVALVSPLDALGDLLFSAHMAQHEVLMLVAAPLLVVGRPLAPFLRALPRSWRERAVAGAGGSGIAAGWRAATAPPAAWTIHALALWAWHAPALYQAALADERVHALQHLSFLGSAALFWWGLVHGRYGRLGYGASVLYVFTTALHGSILGALLTFAPSLWYPVYGERAARWGLSALEDQQLAGLLMWVPAGVILTLLGLALFAAWLGESERRVRALEAGGAEREAPGAG